MTSNIYRFIVFLTLFLLLLLFCKKITIDRTSNTSNAKYLSSYRKVLIPTKFVHNKVL